MADQYYNYNVDPWNSDTPDYIHVQSDHFGGVFGDRIAPTSANYPLGAPTRYFLNLPGIIDTSDLAGSRPFDLYDVTGAVFLTRVSTSPGVNEYRIPPSTSERRNVVELNASQAGDTIGFDFYMIGSIATTDQFGAFSIKVASSDSFSNGNASYIIQTTQDAGAELNTLIAMLGASGGGTLFLAEGTYNVQTAITLNSVNMVIAGSGNATRLVHDALFLTDVIVVTATGAIVRDLEIDGSNGGGAVGLSGVQGTTDTVVQNVYVHNCVTSGLRNIGGSTSNCVVESNTLNGLYWCDNVSNTKANSNTLNGLIACTNITNTEAGSNILSGFSSSKEISSSLSQLNTQDGFNSCTNISGSRSQSNGNNGFSVCSSVGDSRTFDNTIGFSSCNNVANCRSIEDNTTGYFSCRRVSSCTVDTCGTGFSSCQELSSCYATSVVNGFVSCLRVGDSRSESNTYGFITCSNVSNSNAHANTQDGFNSCDILTNNKATNNTVNGFKDCEILTNNNAASNTNDGFLDCVQLSNNIATGNGNYGFNGCTPMSLNRSTGNTTGQYNNCFSNWGASIAAVDTSSGGYNG